MIILPSDAVLKVGSAGPWVSALQAELTRHGFACAADGIFGPLTLQAWLAWQQFAKRNVSTEVTSEDFGDLRRSQDYSQFWSADFVASVCPHAPKQNVAASWPVIAHAMRQRGLCDHALLLLAVATVDTETGSWLSVEELVSSANTRDTPFDRYEGVTVLGNRTPGDGERFKGRGFLQLTGRANYTLFGSRLGVPLHQRPELAVVPGVAASVLAEYFHMRIVPIRKEFVKALRAQSPRWAALRKTVNGGFNGLERFSITMERGLQKLANGE